MWTETKNFEGGKKYKVNLSAFCTDEMCKQLSLQKDFIISRPTEIKSNNKECLRICGGMKGLCIWEKICILFVDVLQIELCHRDINQ